MAAVLRVRTPDEVELDNELIVGARAGNLARVRELIAAGADVSDPAGRFPAVVEAAANGRGNVIRYFLFEYRDARNRPIMMGRFPFSDAFAAALMSGHTDVADIMLESRPGEINELSRRSRKLHRPFARVIENDDVATFDWMIAHNIEPYRGEMRTAIRRGSVHMVVAMLRAGAEHKHINVERIRSADVRSAIERWRVDVRNFNELVGRSTVYRELVFERQQAYTDASASVGAGVFFWTPPYEERGDTVMNDLAQARLKSLCVDGGAMVADERRLVWMNANYSIRPPCYWPRPDAWNADRDLYRDGLRVLELTVGPDDDMLDIDSTFLNDKNYHALLALRGIQGYKPATTAGTAIFNADLWLRADDIETWSAGRLLDEAVNELLERTDVRTVDDVLDNLPCTPAAWARRRVAEHIAAYAERQRPAPPLRQQTVDQWLVKRPRVSVRRMMETARAQNIIDSRNRWTNDAQ